MVIPENNLRKAGVTRQRFNPLWSVIPNWLPKKTIGKVKIRLFILDLINVLLRVLNSEHLSYKQSNYNVNSRNGWQISFCITVAVSYLTTERTK